MKRLLLGLLLFGCAHSPPPPAPVVTQTPVEMVTPSPTPTAPAVSKDDQVIRQAGESTSLGMTNQARVDALMNLLLASGKKRLVANWEVWPDADGTYEATFTIDTIAKKQTIQHPLTRAPGQGPFGNPARAQRRKTDGVQLSWTVDLVKGTCVPRNERTRALLALQPRLPEDEMQQVLPENWRSAAPEPEPVSLPAPAPSEPAQPAEPALPPLPEAVQKEPGTFSGFVGSGPERRAIVSQGGRHLTLAVGDRLNGYKVKAMEDDMLVLEKDGETMRLMPGQNL